MTTQMRSRVTKKGQVTVPSKMRRRYHIETGKSIEFEESDKGILIKPIRDMVDSAGALSKFATAEEMLQELLAARRKSFR